ncbi:hypothetical protein N7522_006372 [Penicillium canescens]|nr:hypothetical protein N7522_006372 [Penicillium canescens]
MTQTGKERASARNGPSPQAEITANGYRIIIAYRQQRLPRFIDYVTNLETSPRYVFGRIFNDKHDSSTRDTASRNRGVDLDCLASASQMDDPGCAPFTGRPCVRPHLRGHFFRPDQCVGGATLSFGP